MTYIEDYTGLGLALTDAPECPNCGTVEHWRASCGLWGGPAPEPEPEHPYGYDGVNHPGGDA